MWIIDVEKSVVGAMLLKVEPKMQRTKKDDPTSPMVPAQDKDGVPKWTVHLSLEVKSFNESTKFDNIQVTVTSPKQPCEGLLQGTPVVIREFELGLMLRGNGGGYSVFYSAEAIVPRQATQFAQSGQTQRMAPVQQPQPVRGAGQ